ncbi:hypothetical protein BGW38_005617, partial [Lunasporangiospora selenospora]
MLSSQLATRVACLALFFIAITYLPGAYAANPVSFCKCICGQTKKITVLPRDAHYPIFGGSSKACNDCTKQFCLDNSPEICKGVGTGDGDELVTNCFERDSYKDQFIVYIFLIVTLSLLGYAGLKPLAKRLWQRHNQRSYTQMPMTFSSRFANREQNQYSSTEMQSRVGRLRTSATRFHILGPGGIGSLFAYYFYQHKIPFTFFQRKAPTAEESALRKSASHSPTTLKYMNLTALDKVSVEPQPVHGIQWEPLYPIIDKELFRSDPVYNQLSRSPIHHLVIATKTFQTVGAISKIRHRLRPWTTIVLLQNGMGVREEISQKSGNTVIHTGRGNVYIAPVYDPSTETSTSPQGSSSLRSLLQRPEDGSLYPELVTPSKKIMSTPYPLGMHSRFSAPFSKDPFSSFYQPLSSTEELVALKTRSLYETLASFQLLSEDMDLK